MAEMKFTPRATFLNPVVPMLPGEDIDRYRWRRNRVVLRARAEWLRAGPIGKALDTNGKPLYRISDSARLTRTNPVRRHRRQEVLHRDGHRCVQCGSTRRLEIDHIVRYIDGGSNEMDNLRTLCHECHSKRGGHA